MSSNARIILHIVYIHGFQGSLSLSSTTQRHLHGNPHTSLYLFQGTIPPSSPFRLIFIMHFNQRFHRTLSCAASCTLPIRLNDPSPSLLRNSSSGACGRGLNLTPRTNSYYVCRLETLPSGPVIVCGHSMGGLLAAEAATSSLHVSKRVFALIAFDVPFLGMHPHVVISGIASLLPHQKREKEGRGSVKAGLKTEKEMNDASHVDVSPVTQSSCMVISSSSDVSAD
jgi:hypothetical protein